MIKCTKCGLVLYDAMFAAGRRVCNMCRNKRAREIYSADPAVSHAKKKKYRDSNPDVMRARHKRWGAARLVKARRVREEFSAGGCAACGIKGPPYIFDFHHVGPKLFSVNGPSLYSKSAASIVAELDKCIVLCALCHRRLHYEPDNIRDSIKGLAEKEKAYSR